MDRNAPSYLNTASAVPPEHGTAAIRELIDIACVACGAGELVERIHISWNDRFFARMGDARWDPTRAVGIIRLSHPLWPMATEDQRLETVVHEACHVIADYKFGCRQGHGAGWRQMMNLCGYEKPRRCHTVAQATIQGRRRRNRRRGTCGCPDGVEVGPVQARRIAAGAAYRCRQCQQTVLLV